MANNKIPNPGSDEAVAQGCICPVLDNDHGRGKWSKAGKPKLFVIRADCPIHTRVKRVIL